MPLVGNPGPARSSGSPPGEGVWAIPPIAIGSARAAVRTPPDRQWGLFRGGGRSPGIIRSHSQWPSSQTSEVFGGPDEAASTDRPAIARAAEAAAMCPWLSGRSCRVLPLRIASALLSFSAPLRSHAAGEAGGVLAGAGVAPRSAAGKARSAGHAAARVRRARAHPRAESPVAEAAAAALPARARGGAHWRRRRAARLAAGDTRSSRFAAVHVPAAQRAVGQNSATPLSVAVPPSLPVGHRLGATHAMMPNALQHTCAALQIIPPQVAPASVTVEHVPRCAQNCRPITEQHSCVGSQVIPPHAPPLPPSLTGLHGTVFARHVGPSGVAQHC